MNSLPLYRADPAREALQARHKAALDALEAAEAQCQALREARHAWWKAQNPIQGTALNEQSLEWAFIRDACRRELESLRRRQRVLDRRQGVAR